MDIKPKLRACVGLVTPAFDRGGLEQVVLNLYRGYKTAGLDSLVLVESNVSAYMASLTDDEEDVVIFRDDERIFLEECFARNVTHLHYHYSTFALAEASSIGIHTTYTLHNVYTWLDDHEFARRAKIIAAANRIVAVSASVRNYFCARSGLALHKVEIIENGVDFNELVEGRPIRRTDLALPASPFLFASIASFHRNKHHAVIIRAAELLLRQRQDFHILMLGAEGDRTYFDEVKARLARSPAAEHITVQPPLPRDRMRSLYEDVVDCVLLPSLQEGCSNVLQEAVGFGRPIITTDVGHAAETAQRFSGVTLIPNAFPDLLKLDAGMVDALSREPEPSNARALADAMNKAIDAAPSPVGADAQRRVRLSADAMVESYLDGFKGGGATARATETNGLAVIEARPIKPSSVEGFN